MDPHIHARFQGFVDLFAVVQRAVCEESRRHAFSDICVEVVFVDTEFFVVDIDLNSLQQMYELLLHIPRPAQSSDLNEILSAPLLTKLKLLPSVIHIQQSEVVSPRPKKYLLGVISMHPLILRPKKHTIAHGEHGADRDNLIDALIVLCFDEHFGEHGLKREFGHSTPEDGLLAQVVQRPQRIQHLQSFDQHIMRRRV